MNIDQIIEQIGTALENFEFSTISEEIKVSALNEANQILYPLKEQGVIEDYQFAVSSIGNIIDVSVFIKELPDQEFSRWDLTITNQS
jgi:hypothetical protein